MHIEQSHWTGNTIKYIWRKVHTFDDKRKSSKGLSFPPGGSKGYSLFLQVIYVLHKLSHSGNFGCSRILSTRENKTERNWETNSICCIENRISKLNSLTIVQSCVDVGQKLSPCSFWLADSLGDSLCCSFFLFTLKKKPIQVFLTYISTQNLFKRINYDNALLILVSYID